jgi:hypothetical protein
MRQSVTSAGFTPAWARAPLMAAAPSFGAGTPAKEPWKAPMGVRVADKITMLDIGIGVIFLFLVLLIVLSARQGERKRTRTIMKVA